MAILKKSATKAEPAKEAKPVKATKPAKAEPATTEEKKEVKNCHTLSYVEGKGWAVKRQGSDKVIKYFDTKIKATEYLVQVSGNQGTTVSIRLKNGKFQKFENATRALNYAKTSKESE